MKRRQFITLTGGAATAWPFEAQAQQSSKKIPTVGVLWHAGSAKEEEVYPRVLVKAFNDLGYIEGKSIILEHRFPAENPERFRTLARDLVDAGLAGRRKCRKIHEFDLYQIIFEMIDPADHRKACERCGLGAQCNAELT
jgi:hypothetical protein